MKVLGSFQVNNGLPPSNGVNAKNISRSNAKGGPKNKQSIKKKLLEAKNQLQFSTD